MPIRIRHVSPASGEEVEAISPPRVPLFLSQQYPWIVLLLFCIILLWPIARGERLYWGDIYLYFEPMYAYLGAALDEGRIPLWNPQIMGGQPFLGNPQMGVFYPSSLLLFFTSPWIYFSMLSFIHVYICGAFMYLFLRRWTATRAAALAGACVYMGSACLLARLQFPPMIQAAAYFPAVFWRLDRALDSPGLRSYVWLSVVISLTILAGHAQIAYFVLLGGMLYGLYRLWANRPRGTCTSAWKTHFLPVLVPLLLFGCLGVLLTSAQTLPALQLLSQSSREHLSPFQANRFSLEPQHLLTIFFPRFLGHPASADYWGNKTAWEPALFVGWLPLYLTGLAVCRRGNFSFVRFWCLIGLIGLWMAFGVWGGLFWLAYALLPGFSNFHDPARFLLWTTFMFSVLTAIGWDVLWKKRYFPIKPRRFGHLLPTITFLGILLPLWWYGVDWNPTTPQSNLVEKTADTTALLAVTQETAEQARIYVPADASVWKRFVTQGYSDYGDVSLHGLSAWKQSWLPNLNMRAGIEIFPGYEPVPVETMVDLEALTLTAWERGEPTLTPLLSILAAPVITMPEASLYILAGFRIWPVQGARPPQGVRIVTSEEAMPRAWLVRQVTVINGRKRVFSALAAPDFHARSTAVVSGPLEENAVLNILTRQNIRAARGGSVRVEEYSRDRMVVRAEAGDAPAFLVLSATGYPGWRVAVNGEVQRPLRANGGLMGTPLSAGSHRLVFFYVPDVYRIGLYLSLMTVCFLAACLAFSRHRLHSRGDQRRVTGEESV